jgi:hypothetical protein
MTYNDPYNPRPQPPSDAMPPESNPPRYRDIDRTGSWNTGYILAAVAAGRGWAHHVGRSRRSADCEQSAGNHGTRRTTAFTDREIARHMSQGKMIRQELARVLPDKQDRIAVQSSAVPEPDKLEV